ncbi:hypothetical protein HYX19_02735 [Candidatus Woesearchaeota archaeon]|nr:hypothetical protein [Candidatus Woesearchaeota archaeon]
MKSQRFLFLLLFLLINLAYAYASPTVLTLLNEKNEFSSGNTVQFYVNLTLDPVRPLIASDIYLSNAQIIKVSSIITKLGNNSYFIYFNLPKLDNGKYNINVRLAYNRDNILQEIVSIIPIAIINQDKQMYLSPGIIVVDIDESSYYQVALYNSGPNQTEVNLSVGGLNLRLSRSSIPLPSGFNKYFYVYFNKTNIRQLNQRVVIDYVTISYLDKEFRIPVYILNKIPEVISMENKTAVEKSIVENKTEIKQKGIDFVVSSKEFDEVLAADDTRAGNIAFKNFLDKPLANIKFSVTGNIRTIVRLNITSMPVLLGNETAKQYIWINEYKNATEGLYEGNITLTTKEGHSAVFFVRVNVAGNGKVEIGDKRSETKSTDLIPSNGLLEEKYGFGNLTSGEKGEPEEKTDNTLAIFFVFIFFVVVFIIIYKMQTKKKSNKDYIGDIKR